MDTKLGAEGRKDLFDWLSKQLSGLSDFCDAVHLLKAAGSAMTVIIYLVVLAKVFLIQCVHTYSFLTIMFFLWNILLRINHQMSEKQLKHASLRF